LFDFFIQLRKFIVAVRSSPQLKQRWAKVCTLEGKEEKQLILDVKVRWNSTGDMIDRGIEYKSVIIVVDFFQISETNFKFFVFN